MTLTEMAQRPRVKPGKINALVQVVALQNKVYAASQDSENQTPKGLSMLARAWCDLEERKRILRGKPMPGSLRPVAKPKKVRTVSNKPLETLPESMLKESLVPEQPLPPSA